MKTDSAGTSNIASWNVADATNIGHQTYRGSSGVWYVNEDTLRIVGKVLQSLSVVKDRSILKQVWDLLSVIGDFLGQLKATGYDLKNLPILVGGIMEDGTFLIEWLSKTSRIGFVIEKDQKESMWYSISKSVTLDSTLSGGLSNKEKSEILKLLVNFLNSVS